MLLILSVYAADMMIPGQKNDAASELTQAIYYRSFAGDLDEWKSRIAQTMTNAIRVSFPTPVNHHYTGTMTQMEPFIHVRWAWLAVPILMVLSSLVFLVVSIVDTTPPRTGLEKQSASIALRIPRPRASLHGNR